MQTQDQHIYVRKLMGFKCKIEYKRGISNKVVDALSRRDVTGSSPRQAYLGEAYQSVVPDISTFILIARPVPHVMELIRKETTSIPDLKKLYRQI